ncbi:YraN family protein [Desulfonatronovibrio magnus]|uniref:YraN family protein n=1 Tax=Desulfonatronovibrio magnus TaxID=698827 RepID=UPI0005EB5A06|nr:YraN family protein [Desulfonatronovibrio magnus]
MANQYLNTGKFGEQAAGSYLTEKGYTILDRNWRYRRGELDIVCTKDNILIFVEVKTRSFQSRAEPVETLGKVQKQTLLRTASHYLCSQGLWEKECRFDFISVTIASEVHINHVKNAFEFSFVGGRNAPWQPW